MASAMRRAWQRNGIPIILFSGLFALPLLMHALARHFA
jgi:hypothetical protein